MTRDEAPRRPYQEAPGMPPREPPGMPHQEPRSLPGSGVSLAGLSVTLVSRVSGGDICESWRGADRHGRPVFVKTLRNAPAGFFTAEARGREFLAVPGGPPLPEILAVTEDALVVSWIEEDRPNPRAAREFGRRLARMHASAPPYFGAAEPGFIGTLPLPNEPTASWPEFYAKCRLRPFLQALPRRQRDVVEEVCDVIDRLAGPTEPPARIHGDLWSGNLVWAADGRVWLVDTAAAHGGHRETDLAMLALFGTPYFDDILAGYHEVAPLDPGWRRRLPLHQLHPLLVHATLFGGGYAERAVAAARTALEILS